MAGNKNGVPEGTPFSFRNGGLTTQLLKQVTQFADYFVGVAFQHFQHGAYHIGNGAVVRSTDQGAYQAGYRVVVILVVDNFNQVPQHGNQSLRGVALYQHARAVSGSLRSIGHHLAVACQLEPVNIHQFQTQGLTLDLDHAKHLIQQGNNVVHADNGLQHSGQIVQVNVQIQLQASVWRRTVDRYRTEGV